MKGLVGGIPLALLVAAVANGYGIGQGHGDAGHDGPTTFFAGPSGDDGGNSAAIELDSSYSSKVKDTYRDDHSFHLKNNVIAPPMPGFRKRGHDDAGHNSPTTFFGGQSGNDGGNEASIEFDGAYSSAEEDWYKDDHSIDIKNHIVHPPPMPGFRKRGHGDAGDDGPTTFFGGPSGDDGGNGASIEFDSSYSSVVEDWYKDDHSFNEKNHIVSPPPMHGFRKRGDREATMFGGPSGDDGGNSAEVEFDSSYASSVKDWYKDDHSIDIDNHIIHPPPMPGFRKRQGNTFFGGPSGDDGGNSADVEFDSTSTSSVKDTYKDDHSVDIKNNIIHPPPVYWKRQRGSFIGGPSGDDGGDSADVDVESSCASSVKDWYKDDHSVDIKNNIIHPDYWKRDDGGEHSHLKDGDAEGGDGKHPKPKGNTLIAGPSGNDGGGSADIEFDRDYSSELEDHYKDDHSVDIKNHIIHPPPIPGFRRRGDGPFVSGGPSHAGPILFDGPSGDDGGNSANFGFDGDYSSNIDDHYEDDHSVKEENWIQPPAHPHPPPFVAKPEPPAPAPSKPCSTSTYLETIVKTLSEEPKPTKPAVPEHSQVYEPKPSSPSYPTHTSKPSYSYKRSSSSSPTHTYPAVPVYKPSSPSYPTHASEAVPSGVSPTHEPEASKAEYDPGYSKPEPVRPPGTSSKAQAHYEPPAPSYPPHAEPVYSAPAELAYEPTTTTPCRPRKPTTPSYPVQESANAQPVYSAPSDPAYEPQPKPQPTTTPRTTRKPAHTSVEPLTATSTITVSRTSFHTTACTSAKAHRPSDVDAKHAPSSTAPIHSQKTPSPTPSTSMMFTGAAGRMTPAGVVSAVCGLMAVLAFVL